MTAVQSPVFPPLQVSAAADVVCPELMYVVPIAVIALILHGVHPEKQILIRLWKVAQCSLWRVPPRHRGGSPKIAGPCGIRAALADTDCAKNATATPPERLAALP